MSDGTKIEWTDATWNPITGCSVVSPGCTNCYAMRLAGTRLQEHPSRKGLTLATKAGPVWNGEVRLNEQWLDQPLRWRRPRRIFVCAHGDLFHENVPEEWIDRVFAVMAAAPQHTFQVLTKRPERMWAYCRSDATVGRLIAHSTELVAGLGSVDVQHLANGMPGIQLPNLWLGVSVENQGWAAARIPLLLDTPATVRFVSAEPLLEPLYLNALKFLDHADFWDLNALGGFRSLKSRRLYGQKLDWVIAGGESGPGARPMHPDWARGLRNQCAAAGVPFFFKQWGEWGPVDLDEIPSETLESAEIEGRYADVSGAPVWRYGKARAGRMLDGRTHDDMPRAYAAKDAAHG